MSESLSGVSLDTRAVVASISSAMRPANMPARDAHRFIAAGLHGKSVRTLQRWSSSNHANKYSFVREKLCGRPKVLSEEKYRLLVRWILTKTDFGCIVKIKDARTF